VVALSPPRTSALGLVVPRGAVDAGPGGRKRGMVLEDLGDYDAESSTVSAPKKSRVSLHSSLVSTRLFHVASR